MFLSDFDFDLPETLIARYPAEERRGSRLLVTGESFQDRRFTELPGLLSPGDLLVLNNTRVIRARIRGRKSTGGKVEILVERVLGDEQVLAQLRASKSPGPGVMIALPGEVTAEVLRREDDMFRLRLSADVMPYLDRYGEVPLPPYLDRGEEADDDARYQTVYATNPGAVAAPTAGLHFDDAMLDELERKGVSKTFVTLHVGAGTFQPLRHEEVDRNRLHSERLHVSAEAAEAVRATREAGGRIIAVGTTSVRALEAASAGGEIEATDAETELFIRPGYRFQSVDAMLTNFHLPRSSLLMLVAAFAGHERVMRAYRHAIAEGYRFFSYGDAMLLWPDKR
jgi:S-adenosylmethionine:tRNA ribosyltransferase-isomerase